MIQPLFPSKCIARTTQKIRKNVILRKINNSSKKVRSFIINNKIDQASLALGRMMINSSTLPPPVKLVANNVIGNLSKPRKQQKSASSLAKNTVASLSPCVMKMYYAVASPWSPMATGACIPTFPARPSQKITAFSRFDVVVGTAGIGFVTISPTLANDTPYAVYTTSTYTGTLGPSDVLFTTATGAISTVGITSSSMANLPYSSSSLVSTLIGAAPVARGRIVSTSMSIVYTGTTLNQAGLLYCFTDPTHDGTSTTTPAQLGARMETDISGTSRDKCWLTAYPITKQECEYERNDGNTLTIAAQAGVTAQQAGISEAINALYPFSSGVAYNNSYSNVTATTLTTLAASAPMIVLITGAVAGSTYHVEVVTHCEFIGSATEGKTTSSGFDTIGSERLLAAFGKIPALRAANPGLDTSKLINMGLKLLNSS